MKISRILFSGMIVFTAGCSFFRSHRPATDFFDTGMKEDFIMVMNHGTETRTALVHLPLGYRESGKYPLVVVLHGGGGNSDNAREMTGFDKAGDREGFITVFPNGSGRLQNRLLTWNSGGCCGYAGENETDDSGFLSALIDTMSLRFPVKPGQVFVTGISNGGMMAYRLALEHPGQIAAIAPVAATFASLPEHPAGPVAVLAIHSLTDRHVPFEGGIGPESLVKKDWIPVGETVMFWVKANGCNPVPESVDSAGFRKEVFKSGTGKEVVLITLAEGGHSWPGGKKGRLTGDEPVKAPEATRLIWEFFKSHPGNPVKQAR
ncbi:MAG: polyhydroxybutyrate depolymerase [Bacteroidetes bacterium]|nr:polyhydroxybutyrate depolymerase [Bacteroidota bacterium]